MIISAAAEEEEEDKGRPTQWSQTTQCFSLTERSASVRVAIVREANQLGTRALLMQQCCSLCLRNHDCTLLYTTEERHPHQLVFHLIGLVRLATSMRHCLARQSLPGEAKKRYTINTFPSHFFADAEVGLWPKQKWPSKFLRIILLILPVVLLLIRVLASECWRQAMDLVACLAFCAVTTCGNRCRREKEPFIDE